MYRVHSQNPQVEPPPPGRGNMPKEETKLLQEQRQQQDRQDSGDEKEPQLILDHLDTNSNTPHQSHNNSGTELLSKYVFFSKILDSLF